MYVRISSTQYASAHERSLKGESWGSWHKSAVRKVNMKQFSFQLEYIFYLYGPKYLQEHVETLLLFLTCLKSISQCNLINDFCSLIVFLNQKPVYLFRGWERCCFLWKKTVKIGNWNPWMYTKMEQIVDLSLFCN